MHELHCACTLLYLVDILEVEPGIEGSDGQVQVWQFEVCHPSADVSLVRVDAKRSESQAVLLQRPQVHRDGVTLVENNSERVCLDLWEAEHSGKFSSILHLWSSHLRKLNPDSIWEAGYEIIFYHLLFFPSPKHIPPKPYN